MSAITSIYNELAIAEFGPVEIDVYIDELQNEIAKSAMHFDYNGYQNAYSELRSIGQKPAIILDMPETGIELPNRAKELEIEDAECEIDSALEMEMGEELDNAAIEAWLTAEKKFNFSEKMRIARAAKKAAK